MGISNVVMVKRLNDGRQVLANQDRYGDVGALTVTRPQAERRLKGLRAAGYVASVSRGPVDRLYIDVVSGPALVVVR